MWWGGAWTRVRPSDTRAPGAHTPCSSARALCAISRALLPRSFIAVENIDSYCVLISSKAVYFLKSGDYVDREAIFLEVKYDDLYHCLVSRDHGKVYVQVTRKAVNTSSGVSIPGPSQQKPMVSVRGPPPHPPGPRVQRVRDRAQGAPLPCPHFSAGLLVGSGCAVVNPPGCCLPTDLLSV